tara:strand:+ start:1537 stop:3003 length:1467 start_codon:yes stop_codon:yes gene_type:complete
MSAKSYLRSFSILFHPSLFLCYLISLSNAKTTEDQIKLLQTSLDTCKTNLTDRSALLRKEEVNYQTLAWEKNLVIAILTISIVVILLIAIFLLVRNQTALSSKSNDSKEQKETTTSANVLPSEISMANIGAKSPAVSDSEEEPQMSDAELAKEIAATKAFMGKNRFIGKFVTKTKQNVLKTKANKVMDDAEIHLQSLQKKMSQRESSASSRLKMRLAQRKSMVAGKGKGKNMLANVAKLEVLSKKERKREKKKLKRQKTIDKAQKKASVKKKKGKSSSTIFKVPHTAVLNGVDFEVVTRIGMRNMGKKKIKNLFKTNEPMKDTKSMFVTCMKPMFLKLKVPEVEWSVVLKHMGARKIGEKNPDNVDSEVVHIHDSDDEDVMDVKEMVLNRDEVLKWMEAGDKVERARLILRDFVPPAVLKRLFQIDQENLGTAQRGLMEQVFPKLGISKEDMPPIFNTLGMAESDSVITEEEFLNWVKVGSAAAALLK